MITQYSTSTMKLITTKITAIRKTMHSTTAKSLVVMLWMTRRPTPGQAKTCSVMTEPRGELHAQDGDDGAHRVFQGMLADDLAFGKTLGLCHIDILLAQHLDEVAAQEPADGGR